MVEKPRLKYCYRAEFLDEENILLVSEKDKTLLSGRLYNLVLHKIQQNSPSLNELIEHLKESYSIFEIYHVIDILEKEGYITETAPSSLPVEICAYWNTQGIEINTLLTVLQNKTVDIETIGPLTQEIFLQAFDEIGLKTDRRDKAGELKLVITDDYQQEKLRQINLDAIKIKQPWMLVKPVGTQLWIGPIFIPGQTGCYECLSQRLVMNRPDNMVYKKHKNTDAVPPVPIAALPISLQTAAGMVAMEIAKWLYFGTNDRLEGKIITFDTKSLASNSHMLMKRPQCTACGEPEYNRRLPDPVIIKKTLSCHITTGGYREVPIEETFRKYQHHVSPITGVVQRLTPYHSVKGTPVHNCSAGDNMAFMNQELSWLNKNLRPGNGGKGSTWSQAKTSALCEGIERYCMIYQGYEPHIISSLNELGDDGIHPNDCMNFSEKQYQEREIYNLGCTKFYAMTPVPFNAFLKIPWSPVYSLVEHKFKYLPLSSCYAQYPEGNDQHIFAYPDSNGYASGNSLEEAMLHGLLELVERDSVAIWWYNRLQKPVVDLSGFNEPYFDQSVEYYRYMHRSLYIFDLTTDLQIPSFVAISHRMDDKKRQDIVFGCGAHVDAKIAIEKALLELSLILPIVDVSDSDRYKGRYRTRNKIFLDWLDMVTMENQPFMALPEASSEKTATDFVRLCEPDIYDSLMFCINSAAENGLETLVLNMTRPDIGLNVVKMVVPGLRHFWKRLAPGRLYDVPVKMGWLDAPLKEEELNPIGVFI